MLCNETYMKIKTPSLKQLASLIKSIKSDIGNEYRAFEDDSIPGIQLTIGADEKGWDFQTGDNSYSGGAYFHRFWGVAGVYRRSNSREVAKDILEQIHTQAA